MVEDRCDEATLAHAADILVKELMCVARGEDVVITTDSAGDRRAVQALYRASRLCGARPAIITIGQLPYQGSLADPYISASVTAAVANCDVWFDATFPYMAGSKPHSAAMEGKRVRSLLLADLGSGGMARLFGNTDLDKLFRMQTRLDEIVTAALGRPCRVQSANGSDFSFVIGKTTTRKLRRTNVPGGYTPPGSAVMYPQKDSVKGTIVIDYAFHEYMTPLHAPIRIEVDREIVSMNGGGADRPVMERALKRAGGGKYGSVIHFSLGFHPAARLTGHSFIEGIRTIGCNAIGLGTPWWEPGGGENHPDGVLAMQSMWIDGQQITQDGAFVAPDLVEMASALQADVFPGIRQ